MEETVETTNNESDKKSTKFTGYHAFYRSVAGLIKEKLPEADISVLSKTTSCMWKRCSSNLRKDWKEKGQLIREDIDCGVISYKCKTCHKSFPRAKDATYHEKNCQECMCMECGKTFSNKVALKRHSKAIHLERHKCKVCNKLFAAQSSLKRHLNVHAGNQEKNIAMQSSQQNST